MGSVVLVTIVDAAVAGLGPRASAVRYFGFLDIPSSKKRLISLKSQLRWSMRRDQGG